MVTARNRWRDMRRAPGGSNGREAAREYTKADGVKRVSELAVPHLELRRLAEQFAALLEPVGDPGHELLDRHARIAKQPVPELAAGKERVFALAAAEDRRLA